MKSQNLFINLRGTVLRSSAENFVTEGLCWVLASNPTVAASIIQLILDKAGLSVDTSQASWSTQASLSTESSPTSRPDMICECVGVVLVFEHKVEAEVSVAQIAAHRTLAAECYSGKPIVTILIARDAERHLKAADVSVTWREVQSLLRRSQFSTSDLRDSLLSQFVEFLGVEGLGRIPGPCPSYWKGNIMEAQRQLPGYRRGYLDLGRKFGDTILLAAVEGELEKDDPDSERDHRLFLEAFRHARSSQRADRAIWTFCRRFFPSYLKYTDDRVGVWLQIPEPQGRKFARGVIESVEEGDMADFL